VGSETHRCYHRPQSDLTSHRPRVCCGQRFACRPASSWVTARIPARYTATSQPVMRVRCGEPFDDYHEPNGRGKSRSCSQARLSSLPSASEQRRGISGRGSIEPPCALTFSDARQQRETLSLSGSRCAHRQARNNMHMHACACACVCMCMSMCMCMLMSMFTWCMCMCMCTACHMVHVACTCPCSHAHVHVHVVRVACACACICTPSVQACE
jgi:hypothetical protein